MRSVFVFPAGGRDETVAVLQACSPHRRDPWVADDGRYTDLVDDDSGSLFLGWMPADVAIVGPRSDTVRPGRCRSSGCLDPYCGTDRRVRCMDGLTIGSLAQRVGVGVETVRFYERRGLMNRPGGSDRRRYTEDSVQRLTLIRRAKALGFSLAEIGELLDAAEGRSARDILDAAHAKLGQVEADLRTLQALHRRLTRLVRACAAGEHDCVALLVDDPEATDGPIAFEELL